LNLFFYTHGVEFQIGKINMSNKQAKQYLIQSVDQIVRHLQQTIKQHRFNYRTFGTEIEDFVTDKLVEILEKGSFIKTKNDYKIARTKNDFPDFTLKSNPYLALEIKSGNRSKISKGQWTTCKNSNNDMGTLNRWFKKIKQFGSENIYYLFIEYNFNDKVQEIINVKIAPFYNFLGLNREGLLKYREKDGNLRPKDFSASSPIQSIKQFNHLFSKTVIFRSKRITKKHLKNIPEKEREKFLEELKN